jgi:hypothetical protein
MQFINAFFIKLTQNSDNNIIRQKRLEVYALEMYSLRLRQCYIHISTFNLRLHVFLTLTLPPLCPVLLDDERLVSCFFREREKFINLFGIE